MTSVAFCWRPLHSGLCGFHYDSMVSISPNFKRGLGMKTGFNPGWTLTHNFESPPSRLQTWSVQTRRLSQCQELTRICILTKHAPSWGSNTISYNYTMTKCTKYVMSVSLIWLASVGNISPSWFLALNTGDGVYSSLSLSSLKGDTPKKGTQILKLQHFHKDDSCSKFHHPKD